MNIVEHEGMFDDCCKYPEPGGIEINVNGFIVAVYKKDGLHVSKKWLHTKYADPITEFRVKAVMEV